MPVFAPESVAANVSFDKAGTLVGSEPEWNLIEGANMALSLVDNAASNRIDVTLAAVTTSFQSVMLALSPASYWKLDETAGTTASDVNSLVNGSYVSTVTKAQAALISTGGTSVLIGGAGTATGGIELGSASYVFSALSPFSWVAWISPAGLDSVGLQNQLVNRAGSNASGAQGYALQSNSLSASTYSLELVRYLNNSGVSAVASGPYTVGDRHLVVGTYDGVNSRLYVDGALQGTSATDTRSIVSVTQNLVLGNSGLGSNNHGLRGLLDEVGVFTRALSLGETSSLYAAGL